MAHIGVTISVASMAFANFSLAGSINGLWNAPPTGNINARFAPAAFMPSQAASTAA